MLCVKMGNRRNYRKYVNFNDRKQSREQVYVNYVNTLLCCLFIVKIGFSVTISIIDVTNSENQSVSILYRLRRQNRFIAIKVPRLQLIGLHFADIVF